MSIRFTVEVTATPAQDEEAMGRLRAYLDVFPADSILIEDPEEPRLVFSSKNPRKALRRVIKSGFPYTMFMVTNLPLDAVTASKDDV